MLPSLVLIKAHIQQTLLLMYGTLLKPENVFGLKKQANKDLIFSSVALQHVIFCVKYHPSSIILLKIFWRWPLLKLEFQKLCEEVHKWEMHMNKLLNGACKTGEATNNANTYVTCTARQAFLWSHLFVHATNTYSREKMEAEKKAGKCYRTNTGQM